MNILEILPVLLGVVSVYYTFKQNILSWVFGILACLLLSYYFFNINFYAQVVLQVVSIIQCVFGIINWKKIDNKEVRKFGTERTLSFIPLSIVLGLIFTHFTNTSNDIWLYLDGMGGFIALFATYLLIVKKIEAWWVFAISNLLLLILCFHQGSYFIGWYYILLILMDVKGYKEWKKELV